MANNNPNVIMNDLANVLTGTPGMVSLQTERRRPLDRFAIPSILPAVFIYQEGLEAVRPGLPSAVADYILSVGIDILDEAATEQTALLTDGGIRAEVLERIRNNPRLSNPTVYLMHDGPHEDPIYDIEKDRAFVTIPLKFGFQFRDSVVIPP